MAQYYLKSERPDHTLQATALVHEAYVKLVDADPNWRDRADFFGIVSSAMRRVLVDQARAKYAAKRPSSQQRIDLDEVPMLLHENFDEIIALDRALERLSQLRRPHGAAAVARRRGELEGSAGSGRIEAADTFMRSEGILRPDRLPSMFLPGQWV